jgi:hypothetical protein
MMNITKCNVCLMTFVYDLYNKDACTLISCRILKMEKFSKIYHLLLLTGI